MHGLSTKHSLYLELMSIFRKIWDSSQALCAQSTQPKEQAQLCQVSHDAWEGILFLQVELQRVEACLDIGERWTPECVEFQKASHHLSIRTYQRAVDKLEGLVVQRLFELTKANVSQTGGLLLYLILYMHGLIHFMLDRLQAADTHIQNPQGLF